MAVKQETLRLYKNKGETPLECIERFKKDNPEYKKDKMTYAGRLDPLAEGLLLVLVGEECKKKEKYLGLDKEYEVDILFGFATDTYDVLGVIKSKVESYKVATNLEIQKIFETFVGKFLQKYPAFSSKNIKKILKTRKNGGLALRSEAGKGELGGGAQSARLIELSMNKVNKKPMSGHFQYGESSVFFETEEETMDKEVEIKTIEFLGERTVSKQDLEKYIIDSVNLVKGNFRQKEILNEWEKAWSRSVLDEFSVFSIKVKCTSGTYMRSLANFIGEKINVPALALNIKRIKIGHYKI